MKTEYTWLAEDILSGGSSEGLPHILKMWCREIYNPNDKLKVILQVEKIN